MGGGGEQASEKVQHLAPHHLNIERTRKLCAFSRSASTPADIRAHAYPAQRSDSARPELPRGTSRPSDQLALRRAQSGHVSKPPPATPTVIQTVCACTRRPCPRPSVSVHRSPSAPLGRAPQLSVDRSIRSVPQWPSTPAHSAKRRIDQAASMHGLQLCSSHAAAARSYTRCSSRRRRQAGALTNRAAGARAAGRGTDPLPAGRLGSKLALLHDEPLLETDGEAGAVHRPRHACCSWSARAKKKLILNEARVKPVQVARPRK